MHYYKRNLGDYAKKAGRLSMLQHGSYTLLIDTCYDREQFPTLDEAIEWTWASTTEEIEAVTFVLRKFFTLENGVYVQKRIQEEISEYHDKAVKNSEIAIQREANRKESTRIVNEKARTVHEVDGINHESPPNHKPITNNHKPITKEKEKKAQAPSAYADLLSDVPKQVVDDWEKLRKAKKATVTRTAIESIVREAGKAGLTLEQALAECCARGWIGFKADWFTDKKSIGQRHDPPKKSFYERDLELKTARIAELTGRAKPIEKNVIDITPKDTNELAITLG